MQKRKEIDHVNDTDKPRSTVTHVITCSGFPDRIWQEWNESCREDFGDCRWMKMWMDHLSAKQNDLLKILLNELSEVKRRLDAIESAGETIEGEAKSETLGRQKEVD